MDTPTSTDFSTSRDFSEGLPKLPGREEGEWTSRAEHHAETRDSSEYFVEPDTVSAIGDIAREFGITVRAIRFYEERGLLRPRCDGTARSYGPRERLHLKMIFKGKELGFTLSEISDIFAAHAEDVETEDFETDGFSATDLSAIAIQRGALGAFDAAKLDLAMALRPEQLAAQIDHLERQRQPLDDAILALREAHRRRVSGDGCRSLR